MPEIINCIVNMTMYFIVLFIYTRSYFDPVYSALGVTCLTKVLSE